MRRGSLSLGVGGGRIGGVRNGSVQIGGLVCAMTALLAAGCATAEHRYMAQHLPDELQATAWQAPCTVDLSPTRSRG